MANIKKAVDYASRGNATRFEDEVKSALDQKAAEKIEAIRKEIAQDLLHIEALQPRTNAGGEKKFVATHKVRKWNHPVAGEDQFTSNKGKAKRRADLEAGDSDGIKDDPDSTVSTLRKTSVAVGPMGEETLGELKEPTLLSYRRKAIKSLRKTTPSYSTRKKREKGLVQADDRLQDDGKFETKHGNKHGFRFDDYYRK